MIDTGLTAANAPYRKGCCYDDSLRNFLLLGDKFEAVLVHGYPHLKGNGNCAGKKFGHAWVEIFAHNLWFVVDSKSPTKTVPSFIYYSVGKIDPEECQRHDFFEVMLNVDEFGISGPWKNVPAEALFSGE